MRKGLLACLVSSVLLLPLVAQGQTRRAESLEELIKMYDVSSCKPCHAQQFEEWEKSIHSRSLVGTGRTGDAFGRMIKGYLLGDQWKHAGVRTVDDIKVEHLMPCLECHAPQVKNASDKVARQLAKAAMDGDTATLAKLNINCIVCHSDKAIVHQWVDGAPEKGVLYGKKEAPHTDVKKYGQIKKSPVMGESIFCGQCHGLGPSFHYPNPVQCGTVYGSYLHNYVPSGGSKSCQECHVQVSGHEMTAYRDGQRAGKTVRMEVDTQTYYAHPKAFEWKPEAVVTVKLTNTAGHRVPDG